MRTSPFPRTSWSLISRAGRHGDRKALAELCRAYHFPVYAFLRRYTGSAEEARDLSQGFFAQRWLEENDLAKVYPTHGSKFRSWLRTCVERYVFNRRRHERAQRRYPGQPIESLDAMAAEARYYQGPADHLTPERLFDRAFALDLLARVLDLLRRASDEATFDALKGCLTSDVEVLPYEEIARALGKSETWVKQAAFRLRKRRWELLRDEVRCLLPDPDDEHAVDEELEQLFEALLE